MLTMKCLNENCGWCESTSDQILVCPLCSGEVFSSIEDQVEEGEDVRALSEAES